MMRSVNLNWDVEKEKLKCQKRIWHPSEIFLLLKTMLTRKVGRPSTAPGSLEMGNDSFAFVLFPVSPDLEDGRVRTFSSLYSDRVMVRCPEKGLATCQTQKKICAWKKNNQNNPFSSFLSLSCFTHRFGNPLHTPYLAGTLISISIITSLSDHHGD